MSAVYILQERASWHAIMTTHPRDPHRGSEVLLTAWLYLPISVVLIHTACPRGHYLSSLCALWDHAGMTVLAELDSAA